MAVTSAGSGTQTAVLTTEHTLLDTSSAGTYLLKVDLNAMAAGDQVELRLYDMVLTSGTRRVAYFATFQGAQPTDNQIEESVPISTDLTDSGAIRATLKQVAGTGRNFPWKVLKFA